MNTFEMKVRIEPAVNLAAEIERVVAVATAQIRDGQRGAEVLNAQGHVCGWWQIEESTEVNYFALVMSLAVG
jgi:hypothetical protein